MGDLNLLIEVHVTCPDGREENFTGYPVARGRILTARHGLVPGDQAPGKTIEVRRHHQTGEARAWVTATIVRHRRHRRWTGRAAPVPGKPGPAHARRPRVP